jgi:hypothetical protein
MDKRFNDYIKNKERYIDAEQIYEYGYTQGRQDALRECLEICLKSNLYCGDIIESIQKLMQQENINNETKEK